MNKKTGGEVQRMGGSRANGVEGGRGEKNIFVGKTKRK